MDSLKEGLRSGVLFCRGILKRLYWWAPALLLDPFDLYNKYIRRSFGGEEITLPSEWFPIVFVCGFSIAAIFTYHELRMKSLREKALEDQARSFVKEAVTSLRDVLVAEKDSKSAEEVSFEIVSDVTTFVSGTTTKDLKEFGASIPPSVPFIVICNFRKQSRLDTIWMGLRLNSTLVDGPGGRIVSASDEPHQGVVTWHVGAVDEWGLRRIRTHWSTGSTVTNFGVEGKAAEIIRELAISGRSDAGYFELLQFSAYSWPT